MTLGVRWLSPHRKDCTAVKSWPDTPWWLPGTWETRDRLGRKGNSGGTRWLRVECNNASCEAVALVRETDVTRLVEKALRQQRPGAHTESECVLAHPHEGEHARCDMCWLTEQHRQVLARERGLYGRMVDERERREHAEMDALELRLLVTRLAGALDSLAQHHQPCAATARTARICGQASRALALLANPLVVACREEEGKKC